MDERTFRCLEISGIAYKIDTLASLGIAWAHGAEWQWPEALSTISESVDVLLHLPLIVDNVPAHGVVLVTASL